MKSLKEDIISLMKEFNEMESKKLQIQQLLSLINKLEDHSIDNENLFVKIEELIGNLRSIMNGNNGLKIIYKKSYYQLKQNIQKNQSIVIPCIWYMRKSQWITKQCLQKTFQGPEIVV